MKKMKHIELL